MTVTLDGKTLDVKSFHEDFLVVNAQSDVWVVGVYLRKVSVRGVIRKWNVQCVENAVNWASSQAKSFQDTAAAGTTVTFAISDQVRVLSTSVYILQMALDAQDLAGKNVRRFTVSLQESVVSSGGGGGGGGGALDHGLLGGLLDDDHPQYLLVDGSRNALKLILTDGANHYLQVPQLTTSERDGLSAVNGMVIYNSTMGQFQRFQSGLWGSFESGASLNPVNPPDVIGYKYGGQYYTKRMLDGAILGQGASGLTPLQNAVNDASTGSILLSDDYDATGGTLTIAKSNVSIFSFMAKGGDSGGDWYQTPNIDRILIDASAAYRRNLYLAGLCTKEIDLYAQTNPIIKLDLDRISLRPSSGYYGLRFRGSSYIDYVHANNLTIMDLLDNSATGRGSISFENTAEGTGQIWLNNVNYKARSNGARLIGIQDGARVDQLLKIDGMSYVVWGFTGCELFRLGAGSKIVMGLKLINSRLEHHNPATLFNFTGGGGDGMTTHQIDFNHNTLVAPSSGDGGGQVTFMDNAIADAKYRQYLMSYVRGHGNTILSEATGGTFAMGTTGACAHNIVDVGYVYWRGTTEVNNVALKG